jgi:REP element-mobilizing transposase RayT
MGRSRYTIQDERAPHFLTCTVADWLPLFVNPLAAEIVLDSLAFLHKSRRITLWAYVLMENHMHMIASAERLSREVQAFKSFTARRIVDSLEETGSYSMLGKLQRAKLSHKRDRKHQVWQEGSHPKILEGQAMIQQKISYIHDNPVKRGYVDDPRHWRYSSARNYAGEAGLIEVAVDW